MEKETGDSDLIVAKLGTGALSNDAKNALDLETIDRLASDFRAINQLNVSDTSHGVENLRTVFVSSAAVTAGVEVMGVDRPDDENTEAIQLASMVGNKHLFRTLENSLGLYVAEGLVTHHELDIEEVWDIIVGATANALKEGIVPVFNENDAVSVAELFSRIRDEKGVERKRFGDNDQLASHLARKLGGFVTAYAGVDTTLVFLTDTDGFREDKNDPDSVVGLMYSDDMDGYFEAIDDSNSSNGGMWSKLSAAREAAQAGVRVVISSAKEKNPLLRALTGKAGTVILPSVSEVARVESTSNHF